MKKIIFVIFLMTTSNSLVLAQGGQGGRQFDPSQIVKTEKQLLLDSISGLNDDQKLIIEAIYEDYLVSFTEARENMDPDNRAAMREDMARIREAKEAALKDILTEEQYTTFMTLLEKRREARRQRRQGERND